MGGSLRGPSFWDHSFHLSHKVSSISIGISVLFAAASVNPSTVLTHSQCSNADCINKAVILQRQMISGLPHFTKDNPHSSSIKSYCLGVPGIGSILCQITSPNLTILCWCFTATHPNHFYTLSKYAQVNESCTVTITFNVCLTITSTT